MKKVVIIGAGLIGCFSARALSKYDLDTLITTMNNWDFSMFTYVLEYRSIFNIIKCIEYIVNV